MHKIKFVKLRDISTWSPTVLHYLELGKKSYITYGPDLVPCPPCKGGGFRMWMTDEEKEEFLEVWRAYTAILYEPDMAKARKMEKSGDPEMKALGRILVNKFKEERGWREALNKVNALRSKFIERNVYKKRKDKVDAIES